MLQLHKISPAGRDDNAWTVNNALDRKNWNEYQLPHNAVNN